MITRKNLCLGFSGVRAWLLIRGLAREEHWKDGRNNQEAWPVAVWPDKRAKYSCSFEISFLLLKDPRVSC